MNYKKIYEQLIESRKLNTTESDYYETHHITPRSLGGDNSKENIIKLTAREHYMAHRLLAKIYGGSMWVALAFMCHGRTRSAYGVKVKSRVYEKAKKEMAKHYSISMLGEANPNYGNSKVKGEANGRYNGELFKWQNKHTGEIIECTRYEAYTAHGMDKVGVLTAISSKSKRKGVKDWRILSEREAPVLGVKKCTICLEEKWLGGFRRDASVRGGFGAVCKLCYRDYEKTRNKGQ